MADPIVFAAEEPLPLTGERTAPDIPDENYWFRRHVVAYRFAARLVAGRRVLDAGCGEGYGTELLASSARTVTGIDLEHPVLARAGARYGSTRFALGNLVGLPFASASFDAVVSLQVIEHLHSPVDFLAECRRVVRPGGLLVLATPNRLTFTPEGAVRNLFHTVEFSPPELRATLARSFSEVELFGVFHGARIRRWSIGGSFPERLIHEPAPSWSPRLRRRVHRVAEGDFAIRATGLDRSLDLVAVAIAR